MWVAGREGGWAGQEHGQGQGAAEAQGRGGAGAGGCRCRGPRNDGMLTPSLVYAHCGVPDRPNHVATPDLL
jgi:hypothetical protein